MTEAKEGMDVGYVADLARIELTDGETALFQGQLDQVLHYVEQLGELDVLSSAEPATCGGRVYTTRPLLAYRIFFCLISLSLPVQ